MHWLWAADDGIFRLFDGHPALAPLRLLARLLLLAASGGACWYVIFLLLFLASGHRGRRLALTGALAVLLAHIGTWGLAGLFQRAAPGAVLARPALVLTAFVPRFSFPSGRVAQGFAALPFLRRGGSAATTLVWVLAAGSAWAQLYAGTAFPTDVAGGVALGLACAGTAVWILGSPFRPRTGQVIPLPRRHRAPLRP